MRPSNAPRAPGGARRVTAAVVLGLALLASACARRPAETPAAPKPPEKIIVTYATNGDLAEWDPATSFDQTSFVMLNMYEPLLWYNPPGSPEPFTPALAERWESSPDGTEWTFQIRKGVKFHNGEDLDAEAVRLSIQRVIDVGGGAAFIWSAVEKMEVTDSHTLKFKLKYPAALDLIASAGYGTYIVCPEANKRPDANAWFMAGNACGTGPYKFSRWTPGEEVVIERFDDYWGGWEPGQVDVGVFRVVREWSTARQALEAGEISFSREAPAEQLAALRQNPKLNVEVYPSYQNLGAHFNTRRGALQDKRVRQAMAYAVDYDAIVNGVLGGLGQQAQGVIPRAVWGHNPNLKLYTYDLDKARQLLKDAGYPNGGLKFTAVYEPGDENERRVMELWKTSLAQIGIELDVQAIPWSTRWENQKNPDTAYDIFVFYWWPTYVTPYDWLYSMFHTEEQPLFNMAYWYNADFDKLIDEADALTGTDRERAIQMFQQAQEILNEELPAVFFYEQQTPTVWNKDFTGYVDNPAYPNVIFFYPLRYQPSGG